MPALVGALAVQHRSFTASGTPCSVPRHWPAAISRSATAACCMAESAMTVMKARHSPSSASMRASIACVSSTGDTVQRRNWSARSWIDA